MGKNLPIEMTKLKLIKRTEPPEIGDTVFVGLDLSLTGTGIVSMGDGDSPLKEKLITTTPDKFTCTEARLGYIKGQVIEFLKEYLNRTSIKLAIEGVSFGSRGSRLAQISGLHYVVRDYLYRKKEAGQLVYEVVPPTVVKKFITGKGNAKKELMLMKVYKKWKLEFTNNNICDAYCLARYAKEEG